MQARIDYPSITVADFAKFLSVATNTLYGWRSNGYGPASHKFDDQVFYYRHDVEQYVREQYRVMHEPQSPISMHEGMPLVRDRAAAAFLGVTTNILYGWRMRHLGPNYFRMSISIVRYRQEDLDYYKTFMESGNGPKVKRPIVAAILSDQSPVNISVVPANVPPVSWKVTLWARFMRVLNYRLF